MNADLCLNRPTNSTILKNHFSKYNTQIVISRIRCIFFSRLVWCGINEFVRSMGRRFFCLDWIWSFIKNSNNSPSDNAHTFSSHVRKVKIITTSNKGIYSYWLLQVTALNYENVSVFDTNFCHTAFEWMSDGTIRFFPSLTRSPFLVIVAGLPSTRLYIVWHSRIFTFSFPHFFVIHSNSILCSSFLYIAFRSIDNCICIR